MTYFDRSRRLSDDSVYTPTSRRIQSPSPSLWPRTFLGNLEDRRKKQGKEPGYRNQRARYLLNLSNRLLSPLHYLSGTPAVYLARMPYENNYQQFIDQPSKRRLFSWKGIGSLFMAIPSLVFGGLARGLALGTDKAFGGDLYTQLKIAKMKVMRQRHHEQANDGPKYQGQLILRDSLWGDVEASGLEQPLRSSRQRLTANYDERRDHHFETSHRSVATCSDSAVITPRGSHSIA